MTDLLNWSAQRVIVTGGAGFVGTHLVEHLKTLGVGELFVPRSRDYDLRQAEQIKRLFEEHPNATMLIHLAATVGGIGANRSHPGTFSYDNLMMGTELLQRARLSGVEKFVGIGTICSYPKFTAVPFREEDLWNGYPEETNAPYGLAKKMLLVQSQAYRTEFDYNAIHLMPTNLYGPGDNFDLESSHVVPALIRKTHDAKVRGRDTVTIWGSGRPRREFLYVDDCADALVHLMEHYSGPDPINVGTGTDLTIADLGRKIAGVVGFSGALTCDRSRPDGTPRKLLDVAYLRRLGWRAPTSLDDGLARTYRWFTENMTETADAAAV